MMLIIASRIQYVTVYVYELTFHLHPKEGGPSGSGKRWEWIDRSTTADGRLTGLFGLSKRLRFFHSGGSFLNKEHNDGCRKGNPRSITKRRV